MFRKIYLFFRNTFNDFIQRNTDLIEGYENLQRFDKNTLLVVSRDETDYLTNNLSTSRLFWVVMVRVLVVFHTLRYGVSALVNKHSVREFHLDFGFMMGPPRLISSAITTLSLAIVAIGLEVVYLELTNQLHFFEIAYIITTKQIKYPLNSKNGRKFALKFNLMARYLVPIAYWVTFIAVFHFIFTFIYYLTLEEKVVFIHKTYNLQHIVAVIHSLVFVHNLSQI